MGKVMPEHTYETFVGVKGDAKQGGVYRYDYDAGANRLELVKQEVHLCGFTHIARPVCNLYCFPQTQCAV